MRKRVILLFLLLIFRCVLGFISVRGFVPGQVIRISGYPINTYQNTTSCIIKIDKFIFSLETNCARIPKTRIRVIGSIDKSLINRFSGDLGLRDGILEESGLLIDDEQFKESGTRFLYYFRELLVLRFKKFVPEPEAGLLAGIVLGFKKDIGRDFYRQMVESGSIHIAVASGYNILLAGGVIMSLCFWIFKRKAATAIAIFGMILYAVLAGGEPPVLRAVWMASFLYLGQALGRAGLSVWILTLTSWLMLMISPSLIGSASFQLSVGASYGLMVIEPWITTKLGGFLGNAPVDLAGKLGVTTTFSTMLATLPILWWHFGRANMVGIISNVLILPIVPVVMILGSGMMILPWLFAVPAYVFTHWIVLVIRFFGSS